MADNLPLYGIRPFVQKDQMGPVAIECVVATGQSFDVNGGASNVAIRKGDPLTLLSGGTVALCDGFEGASGGVALYGICAGVSQYYSASEEVVVKRDSLPADVSWGTNEARKSKVFVWPLSEWKFWEIDSDGALADRAAYQLLIGELFDHSLAGASGTKVNPRLDISTNSTSDGQWRLEAISNNVANVDFSGLYVKLIVSPYELITTI